MALVVVERIFEAPQQLADLQAREHAAAFCLETHRVRCLKRFFALDGNHMVCVYEAPDAEAVRTSQRTAQLPVEQAWTAIEITGESHPRPRGYTLAVTQRALPAGVTEQHVRYSATDPTGCAGRRRVSHVVTYLASDCSRMCCAFYSPDLESIRVANREVGMGEFEQLWAASLIEASG